MLCYRVLLLCASNTHTHTHTHTHTQIVSFYGSQFIDDRLPVEGTEVTVEGLDKPAVVNKRGMYLFGNDGKKVCMCVCVCVCVCVCGRA